MTASALRHSGKGIRDKALAALAGSILIALAFPASSPARAQAAPAGGGSSQPDVIVNDDVIDSLGPLPWQDGRVQAPAPAAKPAKPRPAQQTATVKPQPKPASAAAPVTAATSALRGGPRIKPAPGIPAEPAPEPAPPEDSASAAPAPAPVPAPAEVTPPAPEPAVAPVISAAAAASPPKPEPPLPPAAATPVSLPPASGVTGQVLFQPNVTDLPDPAKGTLDGVAAALQKNDQLRVQLIAYASGAPDQANQARRISLSRAVAVRTYLIEHGVRSTRIDVRALGNRPDSGAADRVDIVALER